MNWNWNWKLELGLELEWGSPQSLLPLQTDPVLATLEHDTAELIGNGMVTLNSRLAGIEDDKLIVHLVELWTFFWGQVLPYLAGVSPSTPARAPEL